VNFTDLFWFHNLYLPGALYVEPTAKVDGKSYFFGIQSPTHPVQLKTIEGGTVYDYVGTTFLHPLVSDRLVATLRKHMVLGWATYPVEVADEAGKAISGLNGLTVMGRCGNIDRSRSEIVQVRPAVAPGSGRRVLRGLYFEPHSWDGSDIFVPGDSSHIIVTKKVKQILEEACITNAAFTPLPNVEMPILSTT
jgi:hypothetical protein